MPTVFISYSSESQQSADQLARFLTEHGIEVINDQIFRVGDELHDDFNKAIVNANYFIPIISEQGKYSRQLAEEIDGVRNLQRQKGEPVILPILRPGATLPPELQDHMSITLPPGDVPAIYKKILEILKEKDHLIAENSKSEVIVNINDIESIVKDFNKHSEVYRSKARVALILMISVVGISLYLFLFAGSIVGSDWETVQRSVPKAAKAVGPRYIGIRFKFFFEQYLDADRDRNFYLNLFKKDHIEIEPVNRDSTMYRLRVPQYATKDSQSYSDFLLETDRLLYRSNFIIDTSTIPPVWSKLLKNYSR